MKRRSKVSRRRWLVLGGSVALAVILFALRLHGLPPGLQPGGERQALLAEKARLAPYTAQSLASLRSELARAEAQESSPHYSVPVNWHAQALPAGSDGAARIRYRRDAELQWAELVDFVGWIENVQQIESLEIRSSGSLSKREISAAEIIVRGIPGTTRRQSGSTFPEAVGPASSRKVGRGPSLRLASSFAGGLRARLRNRAQRPLRPVPTLRARRPARNSTTIIQSRLPS